MMYVGGKSKVARQIATFIEGLRHGRAVDERFCGALWVTAELSGVRYASDLCRPLITMYLRIQRGWRPPEELTEETFNVLKRSQDSDNPLTAFAGFGCSHMGVYFASYARQKNKKGVSYNFARGARNSLERKFRRLDGVVFRYGDYREIDGPGDAVLYLDPPYRATDAKAYRAVPPFDHDAFWDWCRKRRADGRTVIVSEYVAPADFRCVAEFPTETQLRSGNAKIPRIERLFM